MAIIKIEASRRGLVKEFMTLMNINEDNEDAEPWWVATCTCGIPPVTDRGNFENTVIYALVHVEGAHE
jgi:hypothetical protein